MLPKLNEDGFLPEGIHPATLEEIEEAFGSRNPKRRELMTLLKEALKNLKAAGVEKVWLNGSFISGKDDPGDIDGCWEYTPKLDFNIIDPAFLNPPYTLRKKFKMELFIEGTEAGPEGMPWKIFFQNRKDNIQKKKGIVLLTLGGEL